MFARKNKFGEKQTIAEHLHNVANTCFQNAQFCECQDIAKLFGLVHDAGKYFSWWQEYLDAGDKSKVVEHSKYSFDLLQGIMNGNENEEKLRLIPARHHSFLHKLDETPSGQAPIPEELAREISDLISVVSETWSKIIFKKTSSFESWDKYGVLPWMLYLQTLYSVLVDADRTDAANFDGRTPKQFDSFRLMNERFERHIEQVVKTKKSKMDKVREAVSESCIQASEKQERFFSMTAPTGSGKTFASLRFALKRCVEMGKKRIIYVLPYQSIIKQAYGDLRDIFGEKNVLEYHSSIDDYEKGAAWEEPIIITTYQQFFESFFSFSASRSRKLRYMEDSVIILDETQMFPHKFYCVLETLVEFLTKVYKSDVMVMSATLPDWALVLNPVQVISNPGTLYDASIRVKINILSDNDEDLRSRFLSEKTALYVVNSRERAVKFHKTLPIGSSYRLTTLMTPEDRELVIDEIKDKLKRGEECRIVSTTLIDTGVDISVDAVFRDLADFGAMLQSFGRCNRHANDSIRDVYIINKRYNCGPDVNSRISKTESFLGPRIKKQQRIDSLDSIQEYYKRLIPKSEMMNKKNQTILEITKLESAQNYREISNMLKIIDDVRDDISLIIVKSMDEAEKILERKAQNSLSFREIQKKTISIPEKFLNEGLTLIPFAGTTGNDDDGDGETRVFLVVGGYGPYGYEPSFD